ncbi:glycoside hydrolase family protein [Algoriphagus sp. Y33]|uniref:glycoside hydrolase family protein n=1 Tax=Algoriphagus sp. Y33 TaxID=2772483 RepID=UPI001CE148FB|nr:glycoside hydrolase family protein [Algoriphagus sp. Y33]
MKGLLSCMIFLCIAGFTFGQTEERQRPEEWKGLVKGGKFMDLFLPIPPIGNLTSDTWGTEGVLPRYTDNGIEDGEWSYWGGKIIPGEDGKYHMYVCRWREDTPKGHWEWPNSIVVHAVSDSQMGPFRVVGEIGKGHNPEIFKTESGEYVIYVIDGYYRSASLNGPWEYGQFDFDPRDRPIIEGLSNLTFAKREDGSYLMVCRGGGVWFSKDGLDTYNQVSNSRIYPPVDGRFEDPVVWKDNVQYHLIVNDWLGRIAFYLRSKDGVHWKTDPGEAYMPGIAKYEDGTVEDWFKYERIKIFQDDLGRATQANFAVIDTLKAEDKSNDRHSSKNIGIPLKVGMQLEVLNKKAITFSTKQIKVLIKAEKGFDPITELDFTSLRFGASEEVNFGRGAVVTDFRAKGSDVEVVFSGVGNGFTKDNFAGKLLGKDLSGKPVFGFSRLPGVEYTTAILSAGKPELFLSSGDIITRVENFGQVKSKNAKLALQLIKNGETLLSQTVKLPDLQPFQSAESKFKIPANSAEIVPGEELSFVLTVFSTDGEEVFSGVLEALKNTNDNNSVGYAEIDEIRQ